MLPISPQISLSEEAPQIEQLCSSVFQQSVQNIALTRALLKGMADKTLRSYLAYQRIYL